MLLPYFAETITVMWQAQQAWCTARGQQSSIISDLFEGQLQSSLTCSSCRATCHNFESFQDLSLPLPEEDGLTIQVLSDCLPPETAVSHQQHERCPEHGRGARQHLHVCIQLQYECLSPPGGCSALHRGAGPSCSLGFSRLCCRVPDPFHFTHWPIIDRAGWYGVAPEPDTESRL